MRRAARRSRGLGLLAGEDGGGRAGRGAEAGAAGGAAAPHAGEAAAERGEEADRVALRQISSAVGCLDLASGAGPARWGRGGGVAGVPAAAFRFP